MTNAELDKLKAQIDAALPTAKAGTGISMGTEAYRGFSARGWLVPKPYQPVGVPTLRQDLPTYGDRITLCDPDLPLNVAKVL
ncbi:hypothetical protein QP179_09965 [Sphingomonas aurantiaca]|uniref:hypothetical protein n=1 Tax=Sphingomonas aurantiaca TaxID=185949 RepID=UPI002FE1FC82